MRDVATTQPADADAARKTKTLPDENRDAYFEGPDPITSIQIFGTKHRFQLPRKKRITMGAAPDCDIVLHGIYISGLHCVLERGYDTLRVHDRSKNGTWTDGHPLAEPKHVHPGQTFELPGGVTFLALNQAMNAAHPILSDILGWEDQESLISIDPGWPTPSKVIMWATGNDHILIVGENGCDQDQLAQAIHSISRQRDREIVWVDSIPTDRGQQKELLLRASRTTLVLRIDGEMPVMDEAFRLSLFSTSYRIRVVVSAPSMARVHQVLGPDHPLMRRIELRPLAYRDDQVERLLDRQLEQRGSSLRVTNMTEENRSALRRYGWPRNFDDLRLAADRLSVIAREGTLHRAASALQLPYSTLQKWFTDQLGLSRPLTTETTHTAHQ